MSRDIYQTKIDGHTVTVAPGGDDSDGVFTVYCDDPWTLAVGVAQKYGYPTDDELNDAWRHFVGGLAKSASGG